MCVCLCVSLRKRERKNEIEIERARERVLTSVARLKTPTDDVVDDDVTVSRHSNVVCFCVASHFPVHAMK